MDRLRHLSETRSDVFCNRTKEATYVWPFLSLVSNPQCVIHCPRRIAATTLGSGWLQADQGATKLSDMCATGVRKQLLRPVNTVSSHRRFAVCGLGIAIQLFATLGMWGQSGTTSLSGVVKDKTNAVISDAKVSLSDGSQGASREVKTGPTGVYEFAALPPGTYVLTVEASGFQRFEQTNIQLMINSPATVNVALGVGTGLQTVTVSAQVAPLNTTDASLGIAFNENQIREIPLEGRNVPDLLSLQAGVVYTGNRTDIDLDTDTRGGSVNGARSDQSNITLDGVPVNPKRGYAFQTVMPVTLDSVEEFRVTTTNYGADQGSSSGAQVALVTKSGTNDFHGSVYEYTRNTATSANDYFVKQAELQEGQPNVPPKLIRNIFGASLGGPIIKQRLFFFANYEGTRRAEEKAETETVPSSSLRDGVMIYQCSNPASCPGTTVLGLSGSSYAVPVGYFGLSASQISGLDPLHLGPNPVVVKYLQTQWPVPNAFNVGDGFNYDGYTWRTPISDKENVYISKLDYNITEDGKQRLSVSGALRNEANPEGSFLPGQAASQSLDTYNKGIIGSFSSVITQNLINNFRYGFVRQSVGDIGNTDAAVIYLRGLNDQQNAITYTNAFHRPVHNFYDDIFWTHGRHSWQFGAAVSILRDSTTNYGNSFSSAVTNASWLNTGGFAESSNSPLNPVNGGFPAVSTEFANSYDYPLIALLGMVTQVTAQYNFGRDGNPLPQGAPVSRNYAEDSYELYGQDSWKLKSNFTVTLGLRYSLFSPPWETKGLQVAPTINLTNWFNQRARNMAQGIGSYADPTIQFDWAGPANGKKGYYNWDTHNLGPRIAFAWAPNPSGGLLADVFGDGKTSIRGGFGIVYDRVGEALVNTFDTSGGAFGLSTSLLNPGATLTASTAPRLTSLTTIPTTDLNGNVIYEPPPSGGFPATPPSISSIQWGLDQGIKTPYSYTLDFSIGRELPKNFVLEISYVGRLSHRLLAQEDLAMPLDITDKASGTDYFTAVRALAKLYKSGVTDANFSNSMLSPSVLQYWTDVMAPVVSGGAYNLGVYGGCGSGPGFTTNPVLAAFDLFCGGSGNETYPLISWDSLGIPDANNPSVAYFPLPSATSPQGHPHSFFNSQFSSLYAWRSIGSAAYNAMQVTLRHPMAHGIQFDFNYTLSKSIDISSDAERIGTWGGLSGQVINSWQPNAERAVSDFDATHQFNANWVAKLPFGSGKLMAGNAHGFTEAVIAGWQLSGLFRLTSGFPVNVSNGSQWPTNWQVDGNALLTSRVTTGRYIVTNPKAPDFGAVNMFSNLQNAVDSFTAALPGQSGARNQIRGDGYFGIDLGLAKRWTMPWRDTQSLQFRWEVFNITNSSRFNVQTSSLSITNAGTFGDYTGLITNPRVMQFALRYEF